MFLSLSGVVLALGARYPVQFLSGFDWVLRGSTVPTIFSFFLLHSSLLPAWFFICAVRPGVNISRSQYLRDPPILSLEPLHRLVAFRHLLADFRTAKIPAAARWSIISPNFA